MLLFVFGLTSIIISILRYHNGWLSIQRRIVNNINRNEDVQQQNCRQNVNNQNGDNVNPNVNYQTENQRPNIISLMFRFFYHFFASLLPERPRIAIN